MSLSDYWKVMDQWVDIEDRAIIANLPLGTQIRLAKRVEQSIQGAFGFGFVVGLVGSFVLAVGCFILTTH